MAKNLNVEIFENLKVDGKLEQDFLVIGRGQSENIEIQLGEAAANSEAYDYRISGDQQRDYVNGDYRVRTDFPNEYGYDPIYSNVASGYPAVALAFLNGYWNLFYMTSSSYAVGSEPPIYMTTSTQETPVGGAAEWGGYMNTPDAAFKVEAGVGSGSGSSDSSVATLRYNATAQQIEFAPAGGEFAKVGTSASFGEVIEVPFSNLLQGYSIQHDMNGARPQHLSIWPPPAGIEFNLNSFVIQPDANAGNKTFNGPGYVSFVGSKSSMLKAGTAVMQEFVVTGDTYQDGAYEFPCNGTYQRASGVSGFWVNTNGIVSFGVDSIKHWPNNRVVYEFLDKRSATSSKSFYVEITGLSSVADAPWTGVFVKHEYERLSSTGYETVLCVPAPIVASNGTTNSTTLPTTDGQFYPKLNVSGFGNDYDGIYTRQWTDDYSINAPGKHCHYSNGTHHLYYEVGDSRNFIPAMTYDKLPFCRWIFCDSWPNTTDTAYAAFSEQTLQWPGVSNLSWYTTPNETSEISLSIEEGGSTLEVAGSSNSEVNGSYELLSGTGNSRIWQNTASGAGVQWQIRYENGAWSLGFEQASTWRSYMQDVSGAAEPHAGVYIAFETPGSAAIANNTTTIQYQTHVSKALNFPETELPDQLKVSEAGSIIESKILSRTSVHNANYPTDGDLFIDSSNTYVIRYLDYRWQLMTSGIDIPPVYVSEFTLQWPDNTEWLTNAGGAEPVPTVEVYVSNAVKMSGLTDNYGGLAAANGNYFIVDGTKTGTERVWKHESASYYIRNVYSQWCLVESPDSTSYNLYVQDYSGNNYQAPWDEESGDSLVWYYQGSELSDVEFAPDIAGKTNFFYREISDDASVIPYEGLYIRQLSYPGQVAPLSYKTPGTGSQIWIRTQPYPVTPGEENRKYAIWHSAGNWIVGYLTLAASGIVTSTTPLYTIAVAGQWPWKSLPAMSGKELKVKKTKKTELTAVPQGLNVTASPSDSSLIVTYPHRKISGQHVFPVVGDAFYQFNGTGNKFICSKDYYGKLVWGLQTSSGYDVYNGDAEWSWPDETTMGMSYGGSPATVEAMNTGAANVRLLPSGTSGTTPSYVDLGVYRRLESFNNGSYDIQFNYDSPEIKGDSTLGTTLSAGVKVWIKASDWETFTNAAPEAGVEVKAFVLASPSKVSSNSALGKNGIIISNPGSEDGANSYETSCCYYGVIEKINRNDGKSYLLFTSENAASSAPQLLWPWEFKSLWASAATISMERIELEADPPAPPIALYASGFHERSNGYYANRVISNEYAPTAGDRWRICGIDGAQRYYVDCIWYNGSRQRWEMYYDWNGSHQYSYSSTTTEKWPDDAELQWFWGDRAYITNNTPVEGGSVIRRSDEPITRYMTTEMMILGSADNTYYFDKKLYSLRNSFNYEGVTPTLEDRFALFGVKDARFRGSMEVYHDDSGYYWRAGMYIGNEYESRLTKNVYCPPVATLAEMKWPWEIAEWACTSPGGGGHAIETAPLAFGVSDNPDIVQAVGSFSSKITSGGAGYAPANQTWICTTRDINVENLGSPTYYDRFVSADGRAVVRLSADVGNTNNGCYWYLNFPEYDDSGTSEDRYRRYRSAYYTEQMSQNSPKWPWEVAWTTNTSYWKDENPPPVFVKGDGTNGGFYWGDKITLKTKGSASSTFELPFLGGKQFLNVVNGKYAYKIFGTGSVEISPDFNGEFYLAPELLTWESFENYDVAYKSKKTDRQSWLQSPEGGDPVSIGENGAFGVILGKRSVSADSWIWTFAYFSLQMGGIGHFPQYQRTGASPEGDVWESVSADVAAAPGLVEVQSVANSALQLAAAPNLVPKASDFWQGVIDGNAWKISWSSITKRYEALVLGANFESNVIAVDENGNPTLFPWELTEEQWGATFSAVAEIGIEGSRFEIINSTLTGGDNKTHESSTPANGIYFSRKFGGKFVNSDSAGYNYNTFYIRRQSGNNSNDFRIQEALKFDTEWVGGPQWRLVTKNSEGYYIRFSKQRGENWNSPYPDYASLKPPYFFEKAFFSQRGTYTEKVMPWIGYVIANGQRDYKTLPMFGARFQMLLTVDGVVNQVVDFVYDDSLELLGDAPTSLSRWKGTLNKEASTTRAASSDPTFDWSWDSIQKCWKLYITDDAGYGDATISSVSGDGAEPSLFPWEYENYEFSSWTSGNKVGWIIESFTWQGSRIVVSGIGANYDGYAPNGSYVSLYADPENYAYDSTDSNYCWFNKYGIRFGRWSGSTGWALNANDTSWFNIYAINSSKLPWKDEDFSNDSSYNYKPSNFLVNGRTQKNLTGFTSAVNVLGVHPSLVGRYELIGYENATEGGLETLIYRKSDNGAMLMRSNGNWQLIPSSGVAAYTAADPDSSHFPQDQSLVWEAGANSVSDANRLPFIVAVDGANKLPRANTPELTVSGAGVNLNGAYTSPATFGSWGSAQDWANADGAYTLKCYSNGGELYWALRATGTSVNLYGFPAVINEDGTVQDPFNEDGSSVIWNVIDGTAPAPTVTATIVKTDVLLLSGASPDTINGEYELVDDSAEGDNRIWKHTENEFYVSRGTSYTVWMVRNTNSRPSDPGSGGIYFYGEDTTKANPYNDDGTSYNWYSMSGSGTLSVIKQS